MFSANTSTADSANYIEDVFSTYLYTGTNANQTITNNIDLANKGGLVWAKSRTVGTRNHFLYDTVRGATNALSSDLTSASQVISTGLTSFGATGFTLGSDNSTNSSPEPFASWTFRKQPKFFDVVTYTGDGSTSLRAIAHNLGSTPGCLIIKKLSAADDWIVWHRGLTSTNYYLALNKTDAQADLGVQGFAVSDTTFSVIAGSGANANGATYVAYIFAHNAGGFGLTGTDNVISCGSFTTDSGGNASVNLGYEPQWILYKNIQFANASLDPWCIADNMRGITTTGSTSASYQRLKPNSSDAEAVSGTSLDLTPTGFNMLENRNSSTYIYIAIRRGPMKVPTDATKVYTPIAIAGSGATRFMSTGFPVDLKIHSALSAATHVFSDRLRGGGVDTTRKLYSQLTNDENITTSGRGVLFDSNTGYTLTFNEGNATGDNYIHYALKRAPGFFDEVCYTGTGATQTLNHNLGASPELLIAKKRNTTNDWYVLFPAGGSSARAGYLDATNAFTGASATVWGNGSSYVAPTSTQVTVGSYYSGSDTAVMYLFASCPGVSKVGSYTGNGSTQTINCGFTGGARFVLIKRTDSTGDWYVWDTARGIVSGNDPYLLLNSTAAEVTTTDYISPQSVGFGLTSSAPAALNASGGTYIYLAIA